jgi:hypothetical protein
LEDYSTAVNIAGGNLRWAVRYIPQMLEGPAKIWLNNLPAESINGWMDFEEQFVSNFTSTYKRPNRPQQLDNCRQGDYEIDRDYLTRWCTLRNSWEGVVEQQAIMWFAQGCRHGTMLWKKLQREMLATLAKTIKIADSYALGDPLRPTLASQGQGLSHRNNSNAGGSGQFYRPNNRNKRRDDKPDYRYGLSQVAAVEEEQGAPAVANVRDIRAISSLSSSSNNHSSKLSPSRRRMSRLIRMPVPALARRNSGRSIQWVWPSTSPVCSTHFSRVSRRII